MATQRKSFNPFKNIIHFFADRGLWHAVVGAFMGGIIAFSSGLMVYQLQEKKQMVREMEKRQEDKKILLQGFKNNLEANLEMLKLISSTQKPYLLVNNLNLSFLQSTAQVKYQELDDMELAKELDDVAFRLNSLEQDVRSYQSIFYNPLATAGSSFMATRGELLRRNIILDAASEIKRVIPVLTDVDNELKKIGGE